MVGRQAAMIALLENTATEAGRSLVLRATMAPPQGEPPLPVAAWWLAATTPTKAQQPPQEVASVQQESLGL